MTVMQNYFLCSQSLTKSGLFLTLFLYTAGLYISHIFKLSILIL